jgi:hypothetical protein
LGFGALAQKAREARLLFRLLAIRISLKNDPLLKLKYIS